MTDAVLPIVASRRSGFNSFCPTYITCAEHPDWHGRAEGAAIPDNAHCMRQEVEQSSGSCAEAGISEGENTVERPSCKRTSPPPG